ncbi:hypothetical protein C8J57DRAFT_1231805 [Mycena rebaudengoi]|nr:hypothetical protein C8J57DRAFT_1231805 [Mycena rebaudengoi]
MSKCVAGSRPKNAASKKKKTSPEIVPGGCGSDCGATAPKKKGRRNQNKACRRECTETPGKLDKKNHITARLLLCAHKVRDWLKYELKGPMKKKEGHLPRIGDNSLSRFLRWLSKEVQPASATISRFPTDVIRRIMQNECMQMGQYDVMRPYKFYMAQMKGCKPKQRIPGYITFYWHRA